MIAPVPVAIFATSMAYKHRRVIKRGLKVAATKARNAKEASIIMAREIMKGEDASNPMNRLISFARQTASTEPEQAITDVVSRLQLEGMHMGKCVYKNYMTKDHLGPSLRLKLQSKGFPEDVVNSIVENAQSGKHYEDWDESFVHSPDGESRLCQWALWVQDSDDAHVLVALMATCVSFRTFRFIQEFREAQEPVFADQQEHEHVQIDGWLGRYQDVRLVTRRRQVGERTVFHPVYRQHVMQATDMDAIKVYMMYQACSEAVRLLSIGSEP